MITSLSVTAITFSDEVRSLFCYLSLKSDRVWRGEGEAAIAPQTSNTKAITFCYLSLKSDRV